MTHYVGDSCPGGHDPEKIYGEPTRTITSREELMELAAHKSAGKPLVGDIDPGLSFAIGEILEASIEKYPNDADGMPNWWKGGSYRGFAASVLRHIGRWLMGERLDKESHKPHLWHAATDLMFLISWEERHVGQDDRLHNQHPVGATGIPLTERPHRVARNVDRTVPPQGD